MRVECALPLVAIQHRAQAKLAKQLLSLTSSLKSSRDAKYLSHVLGNLPSLSIFVVKELDEELDLVGHQAEGLRTVLHFCIEALQQASSSTEKVVAFLLSRPRLCSTETAATLIPIFADLYTTKNDTLVLQYFRSLNDADDRGVPGHGYTPRFYSGGDQAQWRRQYQPCAGASSHYAIQARARVRVSTIRTQS